MTASIINHFTPIDRTCFSPLDLDARLIHILEFPNEILIKIFSHLSARDLSAISSVCRRFHSIACDDTLWKNKVEKIRPLWMHVYGEAVLKSPSPSFIFSAQKAAQQGWVLDIEDYVRVDHKKKTITLPGNIPNDKLWRYLLSTFHTKGVLPEKSFSTLEYEYEEGEVEELSISLFFSVEKASPLYREINHFNFSTSLEEDPSRMLQQVLAFLSPGRHEEAQEYVEYKLIFSPNDGTYEL